MSLLSSAVTVATDFNDMADAFSNAQELYNLAVNGGAGGMSEVVDAIQAMSTAIQQGLQNVVNAVTNQTLQQQWSAFSTTLNNIQTACNPLSQQFGDMTPAHVVTQDGVAMPLTQWCETGNSHANIKTGALTILATQLSNLYQLFNNGGSPADPTMLEVWVQLCQAAQSANSASFTAQTQYTLTYQFMQQIFALVGSITYTHEAALALYYADNPTNPKNFVSIAPYVNEYFGNTTVPSSVWGMFNSIMNPMLVPHNPVADNLISATTSDSGVQTNPNPSCVQMPDQSVWDTSIALRVAGGMLSAPGNCYFGAVQLQIASPDSDTQILYLSALPVQVGGGMTFTPEPWISQDSSMSNTGGIVIGTQGNQAYYVNTGWVTPPANVNQDTFSVVTGVGFQMVGNRVGIAVQYSELNMWAVDDPAISPSGTYPPTADANDYIALYGEDGFTTINFTDCRPAGTSDYFLSSNITFVQTYQTGQGNRLGIAMQNALPMHGITWFQPDKAFGSKTLPNPNTTGAPAAA